MAFQEPSFAGRTSMRGVKYFSSSHGFELKVLHLFGKGIRAGFIPYDDKNVHWFFACFSSSQGNPFSPTR